MNSVLENCVALQQVWNKSLDGNLEPEIKGRIIGVFLLVYLWCNYWCKIIVNFNQILVNYITISFKTQ